MYNIIIDNSIIEPIQWAWTLPVTMGISALAGLLGGGKPKVTTTTSDTSSSSSGQFDQSSTPILSQAQNDLIDYFTNAAKNKFNAGAPDLSGYTAGGLQNINDAGDLKSKIMANTLASRGLSFSPAAAFSQVQPQSDRLAQSSSFLNTIPLVKKQLEDQNFQNLLDSFKLLPTGTSASGTSSQSGTSSTKGTTTQPGNALGGLFSGLGAGLFAGLGFGNDKGDQSGGGWDWNKNPNGPGY